MSDASICGLGQTAAMAVLSAMDHWPEMFDRAMTNTLLAFLFLILVIGVLSILPIYLMRRDRQVSESLEDFARERAWRIRRHPTTRRAFIFSPGGEDDSSWELVLTRSGSQGAALTVWKSTLIEWKQEPVLIGPKRDEGFIPAGAGTLANDPSSGVGGELLTRTSGWGALPAPGPWGLFRLGLTPVDLSPQPAGTEELRRHYSILAGSVSLAEGLLSSRVERQLLDWPDQDEPMNAPLILANQDGLSVRLPNDNAARQTQLLERLVDLGAALCEAASSGSGSKGHP